MSILGASSRLAYPPLEGAPSSSLPTLTNDMSSTHFAYVPTVWQLQQVRTMKVGGNESAIKYFQSHGGSAALSSNDPTTKYTCPTAVKYKEELKKRAAADAKL